MGRKARAGVPALQLAAGCTYDEPTPQPAPHLKGLVMRRHQEAARPSSRGGRLEALAAFSYRGCNGCDVKWWNSWFGDALDRATVLRLETPREGSPNQISHSAH